MRTTLVILAGLALVAPACFPPGHVLGPFYSAPNFREPDTVQVLPVQFEDVFREDASALKRAFVDSLRKSTRLRAVMDDTAPTEEVRGLVRFLARQRDGYHLPDSSRVRRLSVIFGTRFLLYVKFDRRYSPDPQTHEEMTTVSVRAELWDGDAGRLVWSGDAWEETTPFDLGRGFSVSRADVELGFNAIHKLLATFLAAPDRNGNPRF